MQLQPHVRRLRFDPSACVRLCKRLLLLFWYLFAATADPAYTIQELTRGIIINMSCSKHIYFTYHILYLVECTYDILGNSCVYVIRTGGWIKVRVPVPLQKLARSRCPRQLHGTSEIHPTLSEDWTSRRWEGPTNYPLQVVRQFTIQNRLNWMGEEMICWNNESLNETSTETNSADIHIQKLTVSFLVPTQPNHQTPLNMWSLMVELESHIHILNRLFLDVTLQVNLTV